jgi:hypothetical protein
MAWPREYAVAPCQRREFPAREVLASALSAWEPTAGQRALVQN